MLPRLRVCEAEPARFSLKALVARPQRRPRSEPHRSEQVSIDQAQALPIERVGLDEVRNLVMAGDRCRVKACEQLENSRAILQGSEREFANDHWMLNDE